MILDYGIPEEVLKKHNITKSEFLFLYQELVNSESVETLKNSLKKKGIGNGPKENLFYLRVREEKFINSIICDYRNFLKMEKRNNLIIPEYLDIAVKLQQLFPKGQRSPGCSVQWRGSKFVIAKKLTTLTRDLGVTFTEEEALDATKRYIEHFNGDFTYMECLEYFILRLKPQFKSNFMSYLENTEESDTEPKDFCELR